LGDAQVLEGEEKRLPNSRGCFECGDTTDFIADCPRRRSMTTLTRMTTPTRMTTATKTTIRRRIASKTTRRRISRRSCPEHVEP
jgi:hypothetical protein